MNDKLRSLEKAISSMRLGKADGRTKPHKPVMLLAILDMFDAGLLAENQIHYTQELVERFQEYFKAVKQEGDWCQPSLPFFHLRTSKFWEHQVIPGREKHYSKLRTSGGGSKRILDNIQYAYLGEDAFVVVSDPTSRWKIRRFILKNFFNPDEQSALMETITKQAQVSAYELVLEGYDSQLDEDVETVVRNVAFRRVVLRAYDYRCAACGFRIVLPEIPSPIDAAHLVPWSESYDDSPTNGLALCKLHHWALDAHLISPTTDLHWQVSGVLDARRDSERELTRLDGLPMLLPQEERFYPHLEAVEWCLKRLLTS